MLNSIALLMNETIIPNYALLCWLSGVEFGLHAVLFGVVFVCVIVLCSVCF